MQRYREEIRDDQILACEEPAAGGGTTVLYLLMYSHEVFRKNYWVKGLRKWGVIFLC